MHTIPQSEALANLPIDKLEQAIEQFLQLVTQRLPDTRLARVVRLAVQGISSSQSPLITQLVRGLARTTKTVWSMAKHFYRLKANSRISHRTLLKGLYALARQQVAQHSPEYLIFALDPVNFEKPYTRARDHKTDLDGLYVLLAGLGSVFAAMATLAPAACHPFPHPGFTFV